MRLISLLTCICLHELLFGKTPTILCMYILTVPIMSTSFPNTSIVSTPLCATPEKELEIIYDFIFMMVVV